MSEPIPDQLAREVDHLLDLIHAGHIVPDPFELLSAALILRQHGELVRADRCVAIARRLLPNLARAGVCRSDE